MMVVCGGTEQIDQDDSGSMPLFICDVICENPSHVAKGETAK